MKVKDEHPSKKSRSSLNDISFETMKETIQSKPRATASYSSPTEHLESSASFHPLGKNGVSVSKTRKNLQELHKVVQHPDNKYFWSDDRLLDWSNEISSELERSFPETIIGCLGSTGVGKSSTLNAMLTDDILPTSGSRACTAAPCELRYNGALTSPGKENPIYKCSVIFVTLQEWHDELTLLVDTCCGTSEILEEIKERRGIMFNAWSKLCQVFGCDVMKSLLGRQKNEVWSELRSDSRIAKLLTITSGEQPFTDVEEGVVDAVEAKMLMKPRSTWPDELIEKCTEAAEIFKETISSFLYRTTGDDGKPQTWPLVKKAVLYGPWEVLSTGACLVDLPGTQDANAARAKVTADYKKNCHQFFIVSPIKRAVDSEVAKMELFGEQFKRQLLMDGQYGNVSFICTQTDTCEPAEVMRDHEDVAREVNGRWEKMIGIKDMIKAIPQEKKDLAEKKRILSKELRRARQSVKSTEKEIEEKQKERKKMGGKGTIERQTAIEEQEDEQHAQDLLKILVAELEEKKQAVIRLETALTKNSEESGPKLKAKLSDLQTDLRATAAVVRNEYCTRRLQADFRAGYEDMTQTRDASLSYVENIQMDVFCVSANDYLKVCNVNGWEGLPNTFSDSDNTQIPALCAWVHDITLKSRAAFTADLDNKASILLEHVMLFVKEYEERSTCKEKFREIFEKETQGLTLKMAAIASNFLNESKSTIEKTLSPALENGATRAKGEAVKTVKSWASKSQGSNDLDYGARFHWLTLRAALKREGIFDSTAVGNIDLNQELYDPMEREISFPWQQTMDTAMTRLFVSATTLCLQEVNRVSQAVVHAFTEMGMKPSRVQSIAPVAKQRGDSRVASVFAGVVAGATETQRELNRAPLEQLADSMRIGYQEAVCVVEGQGFVKRMVSALVKHTEKICEDFFDDVTAQLARDIEIMVDGFATTMRNLGPGVSEEFEKAYSVCWNGRQDIMDPKMKLQIGKFREKLLLHLVCLRKAQEEAHKLIERRPGNES